MLSIQPSTSNGGNVSTRSLPAALSRARRFRPARRRSQAVLILAALAATFLYAETPAVAADVVVDRDVAVADMQTGGPSVRRAAQAALTGSDQDLKNYFGGGYTEALHADERAAAQVLAGMDGPAMRTAALQAIDQSPEAVRSFVNGGWQAPWDADERVRVYRILEGGGPTTKAAAQAALAGSTEAVSEFLANGWETAIRADNRLAATRMLTGAANNSGPVLDAAAAQALSGTPEELAEFLATGQFVARARDKELASIRSLTEQAKQASETTSRESLAASEASTRAANAALEAKKAAQTAAAETKAAGNSAAKADAAAGRAADAAAGAADAARDAIGASKAAMRAARVAADAARQATTAATLTAQAASRAQQAAAAARTGAGDARTARLAAQAARDAAAKARELDQVRAERDRALAQAEAATAASKRAGKDADEAATAADEAGGQSNVSAAQAQRARNAAADARRAAAAADRAADRALSLARAAAKASDQAFTFAAQAAASAEAAAAAAEAAAAAADRAERSATEASKHAEAAVAAANLAVAAAQQADSLEKLAREEDTARLAEATELGTLQAQDALAQESATKAEAGEVAAWNRALLWDTAEEDRVDPATRQLLTEASAAGASAEVVLDRGRRAAVALLTTGGEWSQAAAEEALAGGEVEIRSWLTDGRRAAVGQDDRARAWRLVDTLPAGPEKTAAQTALTGDDTAVQTFLRTRNYAGKTVKDRQQIYAMLPTAGPAVQAAAEAALAGTPADLHRFLRTGQHVARTADERLEVYRVMEAGGPEVKAAGQVALAGPSSFISYFLTASRYQAAQRDVEQAAHVANVRALVGQCQQYAQTALADAAKANQAALAAWGKATEANKAAADATAYANKAAEYATAAGRSAAEAKQSADQAAESATTARNAANSAQASADDAARSAATATAAAQRARADAAAAYAAKREARESANAAGRDAKAANAAATEAANIYTTKLREWEAQQRSTAPGSGAGGVGTAADDHKTWGCLSLEASSVSKECLKVFVDFAGALSYPPKCTALANANTPGCQMLGDLKDFVGENPELMLDMLQFVLMACGLAPGAGEVCDGIDAAVSFGRGDWTGGLLSMGSAVPFLGWGATAIKAFKNSDKLRSIKSLVQKLMKRCAKSSFLPGTRVLLADGRAEEIEDVRPGDSVLATDPALARTGARLVTAAITSVGTKEIVDLRVDTDGRDGTATATISATESHPFWVPARKSWVPAEELTAGTGLRSTDGTLVRVTAVRKHTEITRVHNLTVDDYHTYYVLADRTPVLVHNCGELDADEGVPIPGRADPAHTKKKHIDVDDNDLIIRAADENRDASRWLDQSTAQQVIDYELANRKAEIERWVSSAARGGAKQKVLNGQFGPNGSASLGRVASPSGQVSDTSNTYRIVLQFIPGHKRGYVVETAFPTGRR